MDRELEEQIDEVIQKTVKELKARITRVVGKNINRLLKDQAKDLKSSSSGSRPSTSKRETVPVRHREKETKKKSTSDDDSDDYSE